MGEGEEGDVGAGEEGEGGREGGEGREEDRDDISNTKIAISKTNIGKEFAVNFHHCILTVQLRYFN